MTKQLDLVVRNGTLVTGSVRFKADLGVLDGRIAEIAAPGHLSECARNELDADGLFVRRELSRLWQAHGTKAGGPSDEVAKHFAVQLWLRDRRGAELRV